MVAASVARLANSILAASLGVSTQRDVGRHAFANLSGCGWYLRTAISSLPKLRILDLKTQPT